MPLPGTRARVCDPQQLPPDRCRSRRPARLSARSLPRVTDPRSAGSGGRGKLGLLLPVRTPVTNQEPPSRAATKLASVSLPDTACSASWKLS